MAYTSIQKMIFTWLLYTPLFHTIKYMAVVRDSWFCDQGLLQRKKSASLRPDIEECEAMVTFEEVIEEAGFEKRGDQWLPRQPVAAELLSIG